MLVTIVLIIMALITISILGFFLYIRHVRKRDAKRDEWDILEFMEKHPDKSSLYMMKNDNILTEYSAQQMMPLASTVKIIAAIEYARQTADGLLDKDKRISLSDLDVYYIPGTDGGAHEAWLNQLGDKTEVTLHETAKGMMQFSSNANTEFLLDLLGLEQINHNLTAFNMNNHDEIYYFTSSFLIPAYLHTEESLSLRQVKKKMKQMSMKDYKSYSMIIHYLLKQKKTDDLIDKTTNEKFSLSIEIIQSERLPKGTAKEYTELMNRINQGDVLTEDAQILLSDLLEKEVKLDINRFGFKGGSTLFTNTSALYLTDLDQNKSAAAVFINDTKNVETIWISQKMNRFILRLISDKTFQHEVISRLT